MTTPLTVSLLSDQPGWGRALVSSLPRSLRTSESADADLTLIDGRDDWPSLALARVKLDCRRILVIEPDPTDVVAIADLADAVEESGASLILSERFASDPALPGFRDWLGPAYGTLTLESISGDHPETTEFAQLRLLRACGFSVTELGLVTGGPAISLIEADMQHGERQVHIRLSATQSGAGSTRHLVCAYAPDSTARLELANGGDARPAKACLFSSDGELTLPSIHESAHRHQLRTLVEVEFADSASALRAFANDAALALSTCLNP
jgi:hypothetical protein